MDINIEHVSAAFGHRGISRSSIQRILEELKFPGIIQCKMHVISMPQGRPRITRRVVRVRVYKSVLSHEEFTANYLAAFQKSSSHIKACKMVNNQKLWKLERENANVFTKIEESTNPLDFVGNWTKMQTLGLPTR